MPKIDIRKLLKNDQYFPIVKGTEERLFINPVVAKYMIAKEVRDGKDVDKIVANLTYNDNETPLTESLQKSLKKSAVELLQQYYSRQFNESPADETINKIMEFSDLLSMTTRKGQAKVDYNLEYTMYNMNQLYNPVLAGSHPTLRTSMPTKVGKFGKLKRFWQKWEIRDTELEQYLYKQNQYLNEISEAKLAEWFTRMNEISTIGNYDSSYTSGDPDLELMDGAETLLKEADGTYLNSDAVSKDWKMFKKFMKPDMLDINNINSLTGGSRVTAVEDLTGAQIGLVFDKIIERSKVNKRLRRLFGNKKSNKFYVDAWTKEKYDNARVDAVGSTSYTTTQENFKQNGGEFKHRGYELVALDFASGGMIWFGDASELTFMYQYMMKENSEYYPELSDGDSGFSFWRKGFMTLDVKDAERFIIAYTGSSSDLAATTPGILKDTFDINATEVDAITVYTAPTTVYPYSNTKDAKLYYTTDGSTPDATDTLIEEGTGIDLVDEDVLKVVAVRAYLSNSTPTATITITVP